MEVGSCAVPCRNGIRYPISQNRSIAQFHGVWIQRNVEECGCLVCERILVGMLFCIQNKTNMHNIPLICKLPMRRRAYPIVFIMYHIFHRGFADLNFACIINQSYMELPVGEHDFPL